jgi:hypothetical protein
MFYESMSKPEFKETLSSNIESENPQEQIIYFSKQDIYESYYETLAPMLDVPNTELEDNDSVEFIFIGDLIPSGNMENYYQETIESDSEIYRK